jgi:transposase
MHAYSLDLRLRVLADCDRGLSTRAVATKYSVSESWVRRLKQRRRETGTIAPRQPTPGPKPGWHAYADKLREAIRQTPDATLEELRDRLQLAVALSTLWRAVAALGLSVKKSEPGRRARPARRRCQAGAVAGRAGGAGRGEVGIRR